MGTEQRTNTIEFVHYVRTAARRCRTSAAGDDQINRPVPNEASCVTLVSGYRLASAYYMPPFDDLGMGAGVEETNGSVQVLHAVDPIRC